LGTHGAGDCRRAVPPHPPRPDPAVTYLVTAPARAARPSSRAEHRVAAKAPRQGRGLRPRPSASLRADPWRGAPPASLAPIGRTAKCRDPGHL